MTLFGLLVLAGTYTQTAIATEQEVKNTIVNDNAYVKKISKYLKALILKKVLWSSGLVAD